MRRIVSALIIGGTATLSTVSPVSTAPAQDTSLGGTTRMMYGVMKEQMLIAAADKMPEEHYAFKPVDGVRTYGQIVGHLADMQYTFCSVALGEKNPMPRIEQTKSTKADLTAALREAVKFCDRAYDSLTDTSAVQLVKMGATEMPRVSLLTTNMNHGALHYGNLVTYMRMKGIVPPSSEPGFGRRK